MTKAATEGERKRRKRAKAAQASLQAVCAISGVQIAAAEDRRQRAAVGHTEDAAKAVTRARDRICAVMGWPMDDEHRARARDQRLATHYGRLREARRISAAAYRGYERWETRRQDYARILRGDPAHVTRDATGGPPTMDDIAALKAEEACLSALIATWRPAVKFIADYVIRDTALRPPASFSEPQCEEIDA